MKAFTEIKIGEKMIRIIEFINIIRSIPIFLIILLRGLKNIVKIDTEKYKWYIQNIDKSLFFSFNSLMLRNMCYRNVIIF